LEFGRTSGIVPFMARRSFRSKKPAGEKLVGRDSGTKPDAVVCASGNLAHVYFPAEAGRMSRGAVEAHFPGLISGLTSHPGIGAVLVRGDDGAMVAVASEGKMRIPAVATAGLPAVTESANPLHRYGPGATEALASLESLDHLGDLILIGSVDAKADELVGFEELVGSHGGLGGAQMHPFLLCPAGWIPWADPLVGAVDLHNQLCAWRLAMRPEA
jgi:hypothetical protein